MDEQTHHVLVHLIPALKAFTKSVEKSFHIGMYNGTGEIMLKQYRSLHSRASQLLPRDFYINEILVLPESTEDSDDEKVISQIMLLSEQLLDYLQNMVKEEQQAHTTRNTDDMETLGRDFQQHILDLTRHTLKRALSNFDVEVNISDDPVEPAEPEPKSEDEPES